MKKLRYKLHWASGKSPNKLLKWTIYDWKLICPIFYTENRAMGRKICAILNSEDKGKRNDNART